MRYIELDLYPRDFLGRNHADERGAHYANRSFTTIKRPMLQGYIPDVDVTAAILICPGGGYHSIAFDKEGLDIARVLAASGIAAFALLYRLPQPDAWQANMPPLPLDDARAALHTLSHHAAEFGLAGKKIGVAGFSAGGHLAACVAAKALELGVSRPDFVFLGYPVVSLLPPLAHMGSRTNLLGANSSDSLAASWSTQNLMHTACPPAFIIHAADDKSVPVENSRQLVQRLHALSIPCEYLEHPTGGHGFGLGPQHGYKDAPDWIPQFIEWLRTILA